MQTALIEETYADVEKLMWHVCHTFRRRNGGDVDEMMGEARVVFMKCYTSFDKSQSKFSTYLAAAIYKRLIHVRNFNRRRKAVWDKSLSFQINENTTIGDTVEAKESPAFDFEEYFERLSTDGATVLRLVLQGPDELVAAVEAEGGTKTSWRANLRQYLEDCGWPGRRIKNTFAEMRQVLDMVNS